MVAEHQTAGWRPIETAPKRQLILLAGGDLRTVFGFDVGIGLVWPEGISVLGTRARVSVTYWMPLPAPPPPDFQQYTPDTTLEGPIIRNTK